MNILYVRPFPNEIEAVEAALPEHSVTSVVDVWDAPEETLAHIDVLSVFVDYRVTKDVLDALPACRLIATRSVGYDHIDVEAAQERGITIARVPHYGARTVAEYVFALLFALSRRAYQSSVDMKHNAMTINVAKYEGFDIAGKTLGVVGTGAIGKNVCRIGAGLGMKVVACDAREDSEFALSLGITYASMSELLECADIITLHVPSLPETHHLFNANTFSQCKKGCLLINTARGDIVDTHALINALQSGHLAGAGLDVLEGEHELHNEADLFRHEGQHTDVWRQLAANHVLMAMSNVIVTPHIAFNTKEAKSEITQTTIANIVSWHKGEVQNSVL